MRRVYERPTRKKYYIVIMPPPLHRNLANMGRIFYGIAIAAMGLLTIYYRQLPYMMIPPGHHWLSDHVIWVYISGALLLLAGICIVLEKKSRQVPLLLGTVLLLIFFFYFIPYELMVSPNYKHFGDWENAAKELSLAAGALVIAGRRLIPLPYALSAPLARNEGEVTSAFLALAYCGIALVIAQVNSNRQPF
jgi:hypothetical protein